MKAAAAVLSLGLVVLAQSAGRLTFEVASVRPGAGLALNPRRSGETVAWRGATMGFLVQYAYDVAYYQIAGALPPQPGQTYEIMAKVPAMATEAEVKLMFQSLLEDRFALKVRRETREMAVLELVTDPKGHKLKATHPDTNVAVGGRPLPEGMAAVLLERDGRHLAGKGATMTQLVNSLSGAVQQPVIDRTGLAGLFDFDVVHSPEDAPFDTAPPIRSALQDTLGLRLRNAKASVPVIVIESIGPLTEN